jgi:hypothetical protein
MRHITIINATTAPVSVSICYLSLLQCPDIFYLSPVCETSERSKT